MEKLVVSAQDLEQAPVFPNGGSGEGTSRRIIPLGMAILLGCCALVLPLLCLATIVVWIAVRGKATAVRHAWMSLCCVMLVVSGLLSSLAGLFFFLFLTWNSPVATPVGKTADAYALDVLTSFPVWPSEKTLNPKELAAALDTMVFIVARDGKWARPSREIVAAHGFGSGALLFADREEFLVATNRHVVDGDKWETARPYSGDVVLGLRQGGFGHAQIVGRHKSLDLMLLRVARHRGDERFVQALQAFKKIAVGERIVVLGHPQGLFFTLAEGLVSRTDGDNVIQISAPVSPGSSGGPVFDFQGRLLGIVTAMWDKNAGVAENLNFAIRSDAFLRAEEWNLAPAGEKLLKKFVSATQAIPLPSPEN